MWNSTPYIVLSLLISELAFAQFLEKKSELDEQNGSYLVGNPCIDAASSHSVAGELNDVAGAAAFSSLILFEESFEDPDFAGRGWYDMPAGWLPTLDDTEKAPTGSTRSFRREYLEGATSPIKSAAMRRMFSDTESFYVRYWVRYDENWVGSGQAWHPHEFHVTTTTDIKAVGHNYPTLSWNYLMTYIEHNVKNGAIVPVVGLQDSRNIDTSRIGIDLRDITEARSIAGCNGLQTFSPSISCYQSGGRYYNGILVSAGRDNLISHGEWAKVEVFMQLNTIKSNKAQPDGIMRYWLNGKNVIDVSNAVLRTAQHAEMKFTQFVMAPYIGPGSPANQTFWVDDLLVATTAPPAKRAAPPTNLRAVESVLAQ